MGCETQTSSVYTTARDTAVTAITIIESHSLRPPGLKQSAVSCWACIPWGTVQVQNLKKNNQNGLLLAAASGEMPHSSTWPRPLAWSAGKASSRCCWRLDIPQAPEEDHVFLGKTCRAPSSTTDLTQTLSQSNAGWHKTPTLPCTAAAFFLQPVRGRNSSPQQKRLLPLQPVPPQPVPRPKYNRFSYAICSSQTM